MIVRDYGSKLLLLLVFSMVGMVCCNAQSGKSLSVKKVMCTASPEGEAVPSLLDENGIEFQPLDVVNWKDYPYKPEVSFRIAHTGREILLHYKVKEASVRAVASGDNGRVWEDACVEFFVSPEGDDRYYNFECNCAGRLLIQGGAVNERRPTVSQEVLGMVKRWSSLAGEPFRGTFGRVQLGTGHGYSRFRFLPAFRRFSGRKNMKGNFYKCGDKLQTPHFLSWSPIGLEHPMFHCPAFFGTLFFE